MARVAPTNRKAILLAVFIAFGASFELDFMSVALTTFYTHWQEVIMVNKYIFCEGYTPMLRCVANRMQNSYP
jgi:hypothetical protein